MTESEKTRKVESIYRCVLCEGVLREDGPLNQRCSNCRAGYPEIAGIKMMVLDPQALLLSHAQQIADRSLELRKRQDWLARIEQEPVSDESLFRLKQDYESKLANHELAKEFFVPVSDYLARHQSQKSFLSLLTSYHTGWSFSLMMPWLYKDWGDTEEARFVTKLLSDAILDHTRGERESIAVLGCGACGMLYNLSEFFTNSYGLDLSLLTLLFAKQLLDGGEYVLNLSLPDETFPKMQRQIRLRGPRERRESVKLLAANITNLPFAPSSLSCVVTQYIMDLVTNQSLLATEINRVLAPGGIWINFSTPGSLNAFDVPTHLDLPWYFRRHGFEALDSSLQRCKLLDFTKICNWSLTTEHGNMLFVARKTGSVIEEGRQRFSEYFGGHGSSILSSHPRLTSRYSISMSDKKQFVGGGTRESKLVEVEAWNGYSLLKGAVPAEAVTFLNSLLPQLDGSHELRQIFSALQKEFGDAISEREVVMFLNSLKDMGVIAMS
jgi:SAM-dependent methyltransferase